MKEKKGENPSFSVDYPWIVRTVRVRQWNLIEFIIFQKQNAADGSEGAQALIRTASGPYSRSSIRSFQACRISGSQEADFPVSVQKINNPDPSQGCHGCARHLLEMRSALSSLRGANS